MLQCWRIHKKQVGKTPFLEFAKPARDLPKWIGLADFSVYKILPYRESSPLDIMCANRGKSFEEFPLVFCEDTGPAVPMLEHAADNGFCNLGDGFLDRMMHLEFGMEKVEGTFDKLVA